MARNLNKRVETIAPIEDPVLQAQIDRIIAVYETDNWSAWDAMPDGSYVRRRPRPGDEPRIAQDEFLRIAQRATE
jgi:polyphosphate kinase